MKKQYMVTVVSMLAVATLASTSYATDYTWTGAVDGNWSNTANWVGGNIPADADDDSIYEAGLSFVNGSADKVIFSGSIAPISNVPGIGGGYLVSPVEDRTDAPIMEFNSGGTFNFSLVGREDAIWFNTEGTQTVWTVGDGIGTDDVTVNITASATRHFLARQPGTNTYVVNSDGTLTFNKAVHFRYGSGDTRNTVFVIAGGDVSASSTINALSDGLRYVEFTAAGGSFTAMYGGDYADYAAISNAVASNVAWEVGPGLMLEVVDNTTTFTVSSLPIPPRVSVFRF